MPQALHRQVLAIVAALPYDTDHDLPICSARTYPGMLKTDATTEDSAEHAEASDTTQEHLSELEYFPHVHTTKADSANHKKQGMNRNAVTRTTTRDEAHASGDTPSE